MPVVRRKSSSPKKTPAKAGRSRSRSKGPSSGKTTPSKRKRSKSRGRSKTPSRSAPHSQKKSPGRKPRATTPKKEDATPVRAARQRAEYVKSPLAATPTKTSKGSTVSNLFASVCKSMPTFCCTSSYNRRRGGKWYMYRGYNIPLCALMLALLVCCVFAGYHYRVDLQQQFQRLRARWFKH